MKRQIRFGMFESNSSTSHCCFITSKEAYNEYENGAYLFAGNLSYGWNPITPEKNKPYTREEVKELIKNNYKYYEEIDEEDRDEDEIEDDWDDVIWEADFIWKDRVEDKDWIEDTFYETYTTPGGEEVVAFGYYGYN